ncbi:unnamed protein product [Laminaria digitata]
MLSSPSAGGMRLAGNYAHRGSPGVVRRAASRPISIIRSTSVPGQLQDRSQPPAAPGAGGGSGGNTTTSSRRALHVRDRSLQHDFKTNAAGGFGGIVQSLPIPQAPLLAGSLPPSRFLDDLPPLSLGPQADVESFPTDCGALSTSLKANRLYATSCPANLGGHFGRPPGPTSSMSVLEEGGLDEEEEREEPSPKPKSLTALSILESLAGQAEEDAAAADVPKDVVPGEDAQSVESSSDSSGERQLTIDDDVFELEGLEVADDLAALTLSEAGASSKIA